MPRAEEWDWPPPRRRPPPVEIDVTPERVELGPVLRPRAGPKPPGRVGRTVANGVVSGAMLGLKIAVAVPLTLLAIGCFYVVAVLLKV